MKKNLTIIIKINKRVEKLTFLGIEEEKRFMEGKRVIIGWGNRVLMLGQRFSYDNRKTNDDEGD